MSRAGAWTGEDAKDFIWTLTYTGLRISDVALFDSKRLQGNEVFLRAKKSGGDVYAYIPDWLVARSIAAANMEKGPAPASIVGEHSTRNIHSATTLPRYFLQPGADRRVSAQRSAIELVTKPASEQATAVPTVDPLL